MCIPGTTADAQNVYLIRGGLKHWVISAEWLTRHGMRIEDTIQVEPEKLDTILTGLPVE